MPVDYSPFAIVLISFAIGVGFVFGVMTLVRNRLGWRLKRPEKGLTYECGEDTIGSAWLRFNIRFYLVAIVFLLFEVELVLTLPLILLYRSSWAVPVEETPYMAGHFVLVELALFVGMLVLGLVYVWAKGDLNWVRTMRMGDKPAKRDLMPKRRNVAPKAQANPLGEKL